MLHSNKMMDKGKNDASTKQNLQYTDKVEDVLKRARHPRGLNGSVTRGTRRLNPIHGSKRGRRTRGSSSKGFLNRRLRARSPVLFASSSLIKPPISASPISVMDSTETSGSLGAPLRRWSLVFIEVAVASMGGLAITWVGYGGGRGPLWLAI